MTITFLPQNKNKLKFIFSISWTKIQQNSAKFYMSLLFGKEIIQIFIEISYSAKYTSNANMYMHSYILRIK